MCCPGDQEEAIKYPYNLMRDAGPFVMAKRGRREGTLEHREERKRERTEGGRGGKGRKRERERER